MSFIKRINRSLSFRSKMIYTFFKRKEIFDKFGKMGVRYWNSDLRVFYQIFIEENYYFFPNGFKPNVIVDLGANVGYSTLWYRKYFPHAKIIALEPEANNFKILLNNIESKEGISALQKAIWHKDEELYIKNPEALSWSFETSKLKEKNSQRIVGITIDSLMSQFEIDKIDLLKIDIEGAEFDLFSNEPLIWLEKVGAIMIETHDKKRPGTSDLIDSIMSEAGFTKFTTRDLSCFFRNI
jgi:FkbM family methyltransferase